jgi:toxin ParE1/3/4
MNSQKTPFAINALKEQAFYLQEHVSIEVAERYLDAVEETLTFICKFPEIGTLCEFGHSRLRGIRRWPVRGFENDLLFYQIVEDECLLLFVFHGKQDIDSILKEPPDWKV